MDMFTDQTRYYDMYSKDKLWRLALLGFSGMLYATSPVLAEVNIDEAVAAVGSKVIGFRCVSSPIVS